MDNITNFNQIYSQQFTPLVQTLNNKLLTFERVTTVQIDDIEEKYADLKNTYNKICNISADLRNAPDVPTTNSLDRDMQQVQTSHDKYERIYQQFQQKITQARTGTPTTLRTAHPRALFPSTSGLQFGTENSIQKFPIGIPNISNNCWANSMLQFLMIPAFRKNVVMKLPEEFKDLREFMSTYVRDQNKNESEPGSKPISVASSQKVREMLSMLTGGQISNQPFRQEDAYEALSILMQYVPEQGNSLFTEVTTTRQYTIPPNSSINSKLGTHLCDLNYKGQSTYSTKEYQIFLDLQGNSMLPFEKLVEKAMCNRESEEATYNGCRLKMKEETRTFKTMPKHLVFSIKRFTYSRVGPMKIQAEIALPERYVLPKKYVETGKNGSYVLKGFIRHMGAFGGGHYVAYIKADNGTWLYCSDSQVKIASASEIRAAINQAYIPYYEFEGEVSNHTADQIISTYPRLPSTNQQELQGTYTEKRDALKLQIQDTRKEIQLIEAFRQNPNGTNLEAIPLKTRQLLFTIFGLHSGAPAPLPHGLMQLHINPAKINEILAPWIVQFYNDTDWIMPNVLEQLKNKMHYEEFILICDKNLLVLQEIRKTGSSDALISDLSPSALFTLKQKLGNKPNSEIFRLLKTTANPHFTSRNKVVLIDQFIDYTLELKESYKETLCLKQLKGCKAMLSQHPLSNSQISFFLDQMDPFAYALLKDAVKSTRRLPLNTDVDAYLRLNAKLLLSSDALPLIHKRGGSLLDQLINKYSHV